MPNLPGLNAGTALDGTEPLYSVQANLDVQLSGNQIKNFVLGSVVIATRDLLEGIVAPTNGQAVYLSEGARAGWFTFSTANLATSVSADTLQGIYVAPTAAPTGASGAWVRNFSDRINVLWFGAVGDGVASGQDVPIQAAIDMAIYNGVAGQWPGLKRTVYIPGGFYVTSDTVHCGYGTTTNSVVVEGDGYAFRSQTNFNGTGIICNFNNRPAFNFQMSRGSVLRGVGIMGANYTHLVSTLNSTNDTDAASWVDPTFPASADSRYAPYAAITIDAYSGTAPATAYPAVTYPAFLGAVAQYGKGYSSDVLIEDVGIVGFVAGVVNQPANADAQAEFTQLRRVMIELCKYGVSVGNTQSRNFGMDEVKLNTVYIGITNKTHGVQNGHFGATIKNLHAVYLIILLDIGNTSYLGPLLFTSFYGESMWRIGDVTAGSAGEQAITFQDSEFHFDLLTDARGIPASVLGPMPTTPIFIKFSGCMFSNFPSVLSFTPLSVEMDGCRFLASARDTNPLSESYIVLAHNALRGGFVPHPLGSRFSNRGLKYQHYSPTTKGFLATRITSDTFATAGRESNIPIGVSYIYPEGDDRLAYPFAGYTAAFPKSTMANVVLTNKVLTFELTGRGGTAFLLYGPDNGDVLFDDQTGTVFFVRSRTGDTVTAEMQNNYKSNGSGGFVPVTPFSTTAGHLYGSCTRYYATSLYLRGDTSASSAVITSVACDNLFAAWYEAQIAVGDALGVYDRSDLYVDGPNRAITARNHTAGTITLTGNAARTMTRRRLEFFVRAPPANV